VKSPPIKISLVVVRLETNDTVVWQSAGGVSLILCNVQFTFASQVSDVVLQIHIGVIQLQKQINYIGHQQSYSYSAQ